MTSKPKTAPRNGDVDGRTAATETSQKPLAETVENYNFLDIDTCILDQEWVGQPRRFMEWAGKLADARRDAAQIKADMELVEAELDQEIRANPEEFGLDKITEPAIKKCVLTQKRYTKIRDRNIAIKHRVDVLEAAVNALEHRKKALEDLVKLHGQSYFASPRADNSNKEAMDNVEKRAARQRAFPNPK